MKKIAILSIVSIFCVNLLTAQINTDNEVTLAYFNDSDTTVLKSTKVNIPNSGGTVTIVTDDTGQVRKTVFEIPSNQSNHRNKKGKTRYPQYRYNAFVDLGMNRIDEKNLFNGNEDASSSDFPVINNNKSVSFAIYPIMATVRPASFIGFTGGVGLEWFNYRFNKGMTVTDNNGYTTGAPAWEVFNFDSRNAVLKSKLTASYLNIPVMVNLYFTRRGNFNISAGAMFGVNIGSHTKVKYMNENDNKQKVKMDDNLNLSNFRYGFTARVNWNWVGLYANYYMTPLFKDNKGPKVYPFVVGVSISFGDLFYW